MDELPIFDNTLADKLIQAELTIDRTKDYIEELFLKYEPELYNSLDIEIGTDYYDTSIEIYFNMSLPYPYEPCKEIKQAIYDLGFKMVFWNFRHDGIKGSSDKPITLTSEKDEIRGWEPRHSKNNKEWMCSKYGFVDWRFNEKEYKSSNYR